jgi:hypothetical protein
VDVLPLLVAMPAVREEVSSGVSCVAMGRVRVWSIAILLGVVSSGVQMWSWRYVGMG